MTKVCIIGDSNVTGLYNKELILKMKPWYKGVDFTINWVTELAKRHSDVQFEVHGMPGKGIFSYLTPLESAHNFDIIFIVLSNNRYEYEPVDYVRDYEESYPKNIDYFVWSDNFNQMTLTKKTPISREQKIKHDEIIKNIYDYEEILNTKMIVLQWFNFDAGYHVSREWKDFVVIEYFIQKNMDKYHIDRRTAVNMYHDEHGKETDHLKYHEMMELLDKFIDPVFTQELNKIKNDSRN